MRVRAGRRRPCSDDERWCKDAFCRDGKAIGRPVAERFTKTVLSDTAKDQGTGMKQQTGRNNRLRLVKMAAESLLEEVDSSGGALDPAAVEAIVRRLKDMIEEMEAEWELNPTSNELKGGFRILLDYCEHLTKKR
jgi:hypothetical protein